MYVANGSLLQDEAAEALGAALGLVDLLVPDRDLVEEALLATARYRHAVYELLHAVLARRHGAAVLTLDDRPRSLLAQMGVDALPAG